MTSVLGWDIGGANTKAALVRTRDGLVEDAKVAARYFPIWRRGKELLLNVLEELKGQLAGRIKLDAIGVTMTAELSDVYRTKREGVDHILDCVSKTFGDTPIFVLDTELNLRSVGEAKAEPLKVAGANWPATGWMVSHLIGDCIVVDVGSTTTSIIPIIDGRVASAGKTDLEKLMNGELVYTGSLRTNVAAIVDSIPIRDGVARVSSELFAQSGDVHLILGNIASEDYTVDTADGRGRTRGDAMARLARVICADVETLTEREIVEIANYVYEKQVEQIADGLGRVYDRVKPRQGADIPIVVAGLGRNFLARRASQRAGFRQIIDLAELLGEDIAIAPASVGVALMVASKLEGKIARWDLEEPHPKVPEAHRRSR